MEELDINAILKGTNNLPRKIGELTQEIIDILGIKQNPRDIMMQIERIYHCEHHKNDFESEESYFESLRNIPLIIESPEYVGYNESKNGIIYVKRIREGTAIAIKIVNNDALQFRTMYPLQEFKINRFVKTKRLIPINKDED